MSIVHEWGQIDGSTCKYKGFPVDNLVDLKG